MVRLPLPALAAAAGAAARAAGGGVFFDSLRRRVGGSSGCGWKEIISTGPFTLALFRA